MNFKHLAVTAILALSTAAMPAAQAVVIVTPNTAATTTGDSNNCFPFSCGPRHYQQIYDASLFGGVSGVISRLMFRTDRLNGFNDANLDMSITFSHAATSSATLSTTFANNVGSNATQVLNGTASYSAASRTGQDFNFIIDVADTFVYNGTSNLLMDITMRSGSIGASLDSVMHGVTQVQRVWNTSLTAPTGTTGGDRGLVTAFDIVPSQVPEPGTLALFALGAAGFAAVRRKRKPSLA